MSLARRINQSALLLADDARRVAWKILLAPAEELYCY
jgi:hypothetical protein